MFRKKMNTVFGGEVFFGSGIFLFALCFMLALMTIPRSVSIGLFFCSGLMLLFCLYLKYKKCLNYIHVYENRIENKNKCLSIALSFAAGIMITISIFDLLPESFYYLVDIFDVGLVFLSIVLAMIMGIIVFVFLDKFLTTDVDKLYRIGLFSMIAIIVHNIPEGIITFILASNDIRLGLRK
jgi:zinc transporter ZupT